MARSSVKRFFDGHQWFEIGHFLCSPCGLPLGQVLMFTAVSSWHSFPNGWLHVCGAVLCHGPCSLAAWSFVSPFSVRDALRIHRDNSDRCGLCMLWCYFWALSSRVLPLHGRHEVLRTHRTGAPAFGITSCFLRIGRMPMPLWVRSASWTNICVASMIRRGDNPITGDVTILAMPSRGIGLLEVVCRRARSSPFFILAL